MSITTERSAPNTSLQPAPGGLSEVESAECVLCAALSRLLQSRKLRRAIPPYWGSLGER